MSLPPLEVDLSDGEKLEALKRYRRRYGDELEQIESEMRAIKVNVAEYDFLKQYLGEQPEVKELLDEQGKLEQLEKRRQHVGMLVARLDQVIPKGQGETEAPNFKRF